MTTEGEIAALKSRVACLEFRVAGLSSVNALVVFCLGLDAVLIIIHWWFK